MSFSESSFILKNDGTLWGCGTNNNGQLGLGDKSSKYTFTQITTNTNDIQSVYCGDIHTFILKNDGTLWGCGGNNYGQLGLGDTSDRNTFTPITTNTNDIKSIYCGYSHTYMLKNDGTLWVCGRNNYGQLGLGDTNSRKVFTQIITNMYDIKSVYCGGYHTVISKNEGTLWSCGYNGYGQLGLGDTSSRSSFTQIITNVYDTKSIYCGGGYILILKNDGTLWGCGNNASGQLGLGDNNNRNTLTQITTNTNNIKSIYCGYNHTLILKNDGTLWVCGLNGSGQLGLGDFTSRNTFTQITTNANDIKSVYCGYNHTLILKNDGTLWGCGNNEHGQLGLGDTKSRDIFTQITANTNDVKCFANDYSNIISTIKIYDLKIGYAETLDTNNFRNLPVDKFEKIKVLYTNPDNTYLNCLISFDKKQTWKAFYGNTWTTISDVSPENIILNGMQLKTLDKLDKNKLISGGFTGDLDFKIAMKTNNEKATSSVTKIYIEYK